jgi:CheY-like chemotaxis protein
MNILYIDDDLEDLEIFQDALAVIDPHIVLNTAKDGLEGLKILEELTVRPDLIFVDINMPRMNGKQFLIQLRKTLGLRTIPVIIYSTSSHKEEMDSFKKLGAHKFVIKPSDFENLKRLLRNIIETDLGYAQVPNLRQVQAPPGD